MERYKIQIKRSAAKEIEKLPRNAIVTVLKNIAALSIDPCPQNCKKLSGDEKYRLRCGDCRILYSIEDMVLVVFIVKVGHRKDVYKG